MARSIDTRRIQRESFDASSLTNTIRALESSVTNIENNIGGSVFLTTSEFDDTDPTYYFYGGLDADSAWQINRYLKTTFVRDVANILNNPTKATLALAWTDRLTLSYA